MFYAHIVLAKKGPLARIWLAAHWDKKLTKAHVFETNIEQSIDGIMQPKVKLALRTSGHLLLGVVRIYSRKAKYLLADCNEAFVKIKMAFRPGIVDLPEEHREAAVNAITLPEVFHDFDTALPELNDVDIEAQFSINQSRADEITMREEYGSLSMNIHDDGFGDTNYGFDPESNEVGRIGTELFNDALDDNVPMDSSKDDDPVPGTSKLMDELHSNEGFGNEYENPVPGLYEVELFSEAPVTRPNILPDIAEDRPAEDSDFDDGHFDDGAPSPPSSENSMPGSPMPASSLNQLLEADNPVEEQPAAPEVVPTEKENIEPNAVAPLDEESFALAPVDSSVIKGFSNKSKRKRKLIIDEVKNISGDEMKNQLANTSDIVTTLDLAPPTKRLMFWKETGGVEKLFALPSRELPNEVLFKNYQRHLVTNTVPVEDFSRLGPADVLIVAEQHPEEIASPVVKRRRKQRTPEPVAPLAIPTLPEIPQTPIEPDQSVEPVRHASNSLDFPNSFAAAQGSRADVEQSGITNDSVPGGSGVFDQMAGAITPSGLDHGGMTPHHDVIETIDNIPNLPADQVQSILNASYPNYGFDNQGGLDDKISHDWDGDYDFPASPPPPTAGTAAAATDEQQGIDETVEQFEERVLNKRAAALFVTVRAKMQKRDCLYLSEMTVRNNKKQAAQKFYSLLVLKKFQALDLKQGAQYSDIQITRGPLFENPTL